MNVWPIVILALAYVAVILLYCNRRIRTRLESIRGLLDIINIVAALSVFASLFYTIEQFKMSERQQEKQELQQLAQSLSALVLEFDANIDVCNKILADQTNYANAVSVPENRFHTDVLQHFLVTGTLNDARLRQLVPGKVATDYVSERRVGATSFNIYHKTQASQRI
jgi:hypothetical protein